MNLGSLIQTTATRFSNKTAVIDGEKSFTFREFNERINKLAHSLINKLGLVKGDRVALLLNNRYQYMESRLALEKCGVVWVPLNTLLAEADLYYIIKDSGARALITEKEFLPRISRSISDFNLTTVWVGEHAIISDSIDYNYEELVQAGSPNILKTEVEFADLCSLNYTSGTTGKPKGVMLTHGNWINVYRNMLVDRDINSDDILAHIGPLTHASGSYFMPYFLKGATNLIIQGGFNIPVFLETIQRKKITAFTCVPTMLVRLLNYPELSKFDLSSLRNIGYGAAPMPLEVIKEAIDKFGPVFTQNYGQTEAYMTITYLSKAEHVANGSEAEQKRISSVGRPYTFVEVRIVDEEGKDVPVGQPGEIIVRSEHVMQGYWKLPVETSKVIKDGWLYTGDVAMRDQDGYIYLVDRKKDMIISGGFNIYPREVEEALYSHTAVMEAAVIGVPDKEWGEKVKALVVLKAGCTISEEDLKAFCKEKIGFKAPRVIQYLSEIPKNSTGKIDKKVIRQLYGHVDLAVG